MDRRHFMLSAAALATPTLLRAEPALKLRELYADGGFSDLAREMEGQRVTVTGFMAPPLKAESRFFVLTKLPMAVCPFCESEADWPADILAVYAQRNVRVIPFNVRIDVQGRLELGGYKDPETGFVSRLRLMNATYS